MQVKPLRAVPRCAELQRAVEPLQAEWRGAGRQVIKRRNDSLRVELPTTLWRVELRAKLRRAELRPAELRCER